MNEIYLTPLGSYLLSYSTLQKEEKDVDNLVVWNAKTGKKIGSFTQLPISKETFPFIQWTNDEAIAARMVPNAIHFWSGGEVNGRPLRILKVNRLHSFSLSFDGIGSCFLGVFLAQHKSAPGQIQFYDYSALKMISSKSIYADKVEFSWSPDGQKLLVSTIMDVDRTGRSYYGQSGLYFFSKKLSCIVDTSSKKDGPVHGYCWRPDSLQFLVIFGYMPPKTVIFNLKCDPELEFGSVHRNLACFSPDGRILWLAGLGGGLSGKMEFWNPTELVQYGKADASYSAVLYEWCPNSLALMTAVYSPRMRVDNGFQIWDYHGQLIHKEEFQELFSIAYRPTPSKLFPKPLLTRMHSSLDRREEGVHQSNSESTPSKPSIYRPPHLRGTSNSVRNLNPTDELPRRCQLADKYQAPAIPGDTVVLNGSTSKRKKKKKNPKNRK